MAAPTDIPLVEAIEKVARYLMETTCTFEGVSGDFDRCSALTRCVYEERAAAIFGLTLDEYYDLTNPDADATMEVEGESSTVPPPNGCEYPGEQRGKTDS